MLFFLSFKLVFFFLFLLLCYPSSSHLYNVNFWATYTGYGVRTRYLMHACMYSIVQPVPTPEAATTTVL